MFIALCFSITSCSSDDDDDSGSKSSVSDIINSGDADFAGKTINEDITITKATKVSNANFNGHKITIKCTGVTLDKVTGATVYVDIVPPSSSSRANSTEEELAGVVNFSGCDLIKIEVADRSSAVNITFDKSSEAQTTVTDVIIKASGVKISSNQNATAAITTITMDAAVKDITIGKVNINKVTAPSTAIITITDSSAKIETLAVSDKSDGDSKTIKIVLSVDDDTKISDIIKDKDSQDLVSSLGIKNIIVTGTPKLTYNTSEDFDFNDLAAVITYSDNTTQRVPLNESNAQVYGFDNNIGAKNITVAFTRIKKPQVNGEEYNGYAAASFSCVTQGATLDTSVIPYVKNEDGSIRFICEPKNYDYTKVRLYKVGADGLLEYGDTGNVKGSVETITNICVWMYDIGSCPIDTDAENWDEEFILEKGDDGTFTGTISSDTLKNSVRGLFHFVAQYTIGGVKYRSYLSYVCMTQDNKAKLTNDYYEDSNNGDIWFSIKEIKEVAFAVTLDYCIDSYDKIICYGNANNECVLPFDTTTSYNNKYFNGWYTSKTGGTLVTKATESCTVYAHYESGYSPYLPYTITYTISYDKKYTFTFNPVSYGATVSDGDSVYLVSGATGWNIANDHKMKKVGDTYIIDSNSLALKTGDEKDLIGVTVKSGTNNWSYSFKYVIVPAGATSDSSYKWYGEKELADGYKDKLPIRYYDSSSDDPNYLLDSKYPRDDFSEVTFSLGGGVVLGRDLSNALIIRNNNPKLYYYNAEKAGYKFLGWYTAAQGGNKVTTLTRDCTIYAQYSATSNDHTPYNFDSTNNNYTFTYRPADYKITTENNDEVYLACNKENWVEPSDSNKTDTDNFKLAKDSNGNYAKTFSGSSGIEDIMGDWYGFKFIIKHSDGTCTFAGYYEMKESVQSTVSSDYAEFQGSSGNFILKEIMSTGSFSTIYYNNDQNGYKFVFRPVQYYITLDEDEDIYLACDESGWSNAIENDAYKFTATNQGSGEREVSFSNKTLEQIIGSNFNGYKFVTSKGKWLGVADMIPIYRDNLEAGHKQITGDYNFLVSGLSQ